MENYLITTSYLDYIKPNLQLGGDFAMANHSKTCSICKNKIRKNTAYITDLDTGEFYHKKCYSKEYGKIPKNIKTIKENLKLNPDILQPILKFASSKEGQAAIRQGTGALLKKAEQKGKIPKGSSSEITKTGLMTISALLPKPKPHTPPSGPKPPSPTMSNPQTCQICGKKLRTNSKYLIDQDTGNAFHQSCYRKNYGSIPKNIPEIKNPKPMKDLYPIPKGLTKEEHELMESFRNEFIDYALDDWNELEIMISDPYMEYEEKEIAKMKRELKDELRAAWDAKVKCLIDDRDIDEYLENPKKKSFNNEEKDIISMYYDEGYTIDQIAGLNNVPKSKVSRILKDAKVSPILSPKKIIQGNTLRFFIPKKDLDNVLKKLNRDITENNRRAILDLMKGSAEIEQDYLYGTPEDVLIPHLWSDTEKIEKITSKQPKGSYCIEVEMISPDDFLDQIDKPHTKRNREFMKQILWADLNSIINSDLEDHSLIEWRLGNQGRNYDKYRYLPLSTNPSIRTGSRVMIAHGSGIDSGKTGIVIPREQAPYWRNIPGMYKSPSSNEVPVKLDSGEIIYMFKNRLIPVKTSNPMASLTELQEGIEWMKRMYPEDLERRKKKGYSLIDHKHFWTRKEADKAIRQLKKEHNIPGPGLYGENVMIQSYRPSRGNYYIQVYKKDLKNLYMADAISRPPANEITMIIWATNENEARERAENFDYDEIIEGSPISMDEASPEIIEIRRADSDELLQYAHIKPNPDSKMYVVEVSVYPPSYLGTMYVEAEDIDEARYRAESFDYDDFMKFDIRTSEQPDIEIHEIYTKEKNPRRKKSSKRKMSNPYWTMNDEQKIWDLYDDEGYTAEEIYEEMPKIKLKDIHEIIAKYSNEDIKLSEDTGWGIEQIFCDQCDYVGPMDASREMCPSCLDTTGIIYLDHYMSEFEKIFGPLDMEIIEMWAEGNNHSEISKMTNQTKNHISKIIGKAINYIRKKENQDFKNKFHSQLTKPEELRTEGTRYFDEREGKKYQDKIPQWATCLKDVSIGPYSFNYEHPGMFQWHRGDPEKWIIATPFWDNAVGIPIQYWDEHRPYIESSDEVKYAYIPINYPPGYDIVDYVNDVTLFLMEMGMLKADSLHKTYAMLKENPLSRKEKKKIEQFSRAIEEGWRNNPTKRITIETWRGLVEDVHGLPPGWDYEIIDLDGDEEHEMPPKLSKNILTVVVENGLPDVYNLPKGYVWTVTMPKDEMENPRCRRNIGPAVMAAVQAGGELSKTDQGREVLKFGVTPLIPLEAGKHIAKKMGKHELAEKLGTPGEKIVEPILQQAGGVASQVLSNPQKRKCFTPVIEPEGIGLGIAVEGESGYYKTDYPHYDNYDDAWEHADILNDRLGLSRKDAMVIVGSTFKSIRSNPKNTDYLITMGYEHFDPWDLYYHVHDGTSLIKDKNDKYGAIKTWRSLDSAIDYIKNNDKNADIWLTFAWEQRKFPVKNPKVYFDGNMNNGVGGDPDVESEDAITSAYYEITDELEHGYGLDIDDMRLSEIEKDPNTYEYKYRATGRYKDGQIFDFSFKWFGSAETFDELSWKKGQRNDAMPIRTLKQLFRKWMAGETVELPNVKYKKAKYHHTITELKDIVEEKNGDGWLLYHQPEDQWEQLQYQITPSDILEDFEDVLPNPTKAQAQKTAQWHRDRGKRARVMRIGKQEYAAFIDGKRKIRRVKIKTKPVVPKKRGRPPKKIRMKQVKDLTVDLKDKAYRYGYQAFDNNIETSIDCPKLSRLLKNFDKKSKEILISKWHEGWKVAKANQIQKKKRGRPKKEKPTAVVPKGKTWKPGMTITGKKAIKPAQVPKGLNKIENKILVNTRTNEDYKVIKIKPGINFNNKKNMPYLDLKPLDEYGVISQKQFYVDDIKSLLAGDVVKGFELKDHDEFYVDEDDKFKVTIKNAEDVMEIEKGVYDKTKIPGKINFIHKDLNVHTKGKYKYLILKTDKKWLYGFRIPVDIWNKFGVKYSKNQYYDLHENLLEYQAMAENLLKKKKKLSEEVKREKSVVPKKRGRPKKKPSAVVPKREYPKYQILGFEPKSGYKFIKEIQFDDIEKELDKLFEQQKIKKQYDRIEAVEIDELGKKHTLEGRYLKPKEPVSKSQDEIIGTNVDGQTIYINERGDRYIKRGKIRTTAPTKLIGGPYTPEELYKDYRHDYLTKDEIKKFKAEEAKKMKAHRKLDVGDLIKYTNSDGDYLGEGLVYDVRTVSSGGWRYDINLIDYHKDDKDTSRIYSTDKGITILNKATNVDKAFQAWYDRWKNKKKAKMELTDVQDEIVDIPEETDEGYIITKGKEQFIVNEDMDLATAQAVERFYNEKPKNMKLGEYPRYILDEDWGTLYLDIDHDEDTMEQVAQFFNPNAEVGRYEEEEEQVEFIPSGHPTEIIEMVNEIWGDLNDNGKNDIKRSLKQQDYDEIRSKYKMVMSQPRFATGAIPPGEIFELEATQPIKEEISDKELADMITGGLKELLED